MKYVVTNEVPVGNTVDWQPGILVGGLVTPHMCSRLRVSGNSRPRHVNTSRAGSQRHSHGWPGVCVLHDPRKFLDPLWEHAFAELFYRTKFASSAGKTL